MILHVLIVDDEIDNLESLGQPFREALEKQLENDQAFQAANREVGSPLPDGARIYVKASDHGYKRKQPGAPYPDQQEVHVRLHLCHVKDSLFDEVRRLLNTHFVAVVVSDLRLSSTPGGDRGGQRFLKHAQTVWPEVRNVLYSANLHRPSDFPSEWFVHKAGKFGSPELCTKIVAGMTAYLRHPRVQHFAQALRDTPGGKQPILYRSDAFGAVLRKVYDFAGNDFGPPDAPTSRGGPPTLLIDGETGTGKSRLAELLHRASRRTGKLHKVTSAQYKDRERLNSTLFGHKAKSFNNADEHEGLVSHAKDGMLLLDDLHHIDEEASMSLHNFLDTGVYTPWMAEHLPKQSNAAIVCTVESPRWAEIKEKKLLPESFIARVDQNLLRIPPLAERPEDFVCLFEHHWRSKPGQASVQITQAAMDYLLESGVHRRAARGVEQIAQSLGDDFKGADKIDVKQMDECVRHRGFVPTPPRAAASEGPPREPLPELPPLWAGRVHALAVAALKGKLGSDLDDPDRLKQDLFREVFPDIWGRFKEVKKDHKQFDEELFAELFRYYALVASGNAAKAARELGITPQAYRGWFEDHEAKHLPGLAD